MENEILLTVGDTYQLDAESDGDGIITFEAVEPGMLEITEKIHIKGTILSIKSVVFSLILKGNSDIICIVT